MRPVAAWVWLLAAGLNPASGQQATFSLPLASRSYSAAVTLPGWPSTLYLLDMDRSELVLIDSDGALQARYGGWGSGAQGLDYPVALLAAENSIWILDQGTQRILRLDPRLNEVATLLLPEGSFPLAFARDRQQRFWVARDSEPGLQLIDDAGLLLQAVGDGKAGTAIIQRPTHMAPFSDGMLVWDALSLELLRINLSGHIESRQPLEIEGEVLDMAPSGGTVLLLTPNALWRLDGPALRRVADNDGWVALVRRGEQILALGTDGLYALPLDP